MPTTKHVDNNRSVARVPLRVLVVHTSYQHRGGEDVVVDAECELLAAHGHSVERYGRSNHEIGGYARARIALETHWSRHSAAELSARIARFAPDVVHVHNVFPLMSPSVLWAAQAHAPVVQTVHNFRLLCLQAMLLRNERPCEDCLGTLPWRGVVRRCYRGSLAQSAVAASALALHRMLGTYTRAVDRFIALSEFARAKLAAGGIAPERIRVKPNFVDLPRAPVATARRGALYVGRLAPEKGIVDLARAFAARPAIHLTVVGDGPERARLEGLANVTLLGALPAYAVYERMRTAAYLVMPSVSYEGFPRTLAEAYACGLPVIASRIGSLAELVRDRVTGLAVEPGAPEALARALDWAEAHPTEMARMGGQARAEYESNYTGEHNHRLLEAIYREAISTRKDPAHAAGARPARGSEVW